MAVASAGAGIGRKSGKGRYVLTGIVGQLVRVATLVHRCADQAITKRWLPIIRCHDTAEAIVVSQTMVKLLNIID